MFDRMLKCKNYCLTFSQKNLARGWRVDGGVGDEEEGCDYLNNIHQPLVLFLFYFSRQMELRFLSETVHW